jgi:transcriptional regulator GlxA family with amidase domain
MRNLAIFIFDDVEVLDFAGPFEIFSVCQAKAEKPPFRVFTVAEKDRIIARNGLIVAPHFLLTEAPSIDILLLPGGGGFRKDGTPYGSRKEMDNPELLQWVKDVNTRAELMLSVCTGSLILGKAGLLDGLEVTTHRNAVETMKEAAPHSKLSPEKRWVDNGRIILSAGVSAGMDMSLYVISKLLGKPVADETAYYIQYDHWQ